MIFGVPDTFSTLQSILRTSRGLKTSPTHEYTFPVELVAFLPYLESKHLIDSISHLLTVHCQQ